MPISAERRAEIGMRRAQAVDLAASGYTYREIAKRLQVSPGQAHDDVTKGLAELGGEVGRLKREALLGRELRLLDLVSRAAMPAALQGDPRAALTVFRAVDRRAKLLGLNAPIQVELTDEMDREIRTLAAKLAEDGLWGVDTPDGVDVP